MRLLNLAHLHLQSVIQAGDSVIDATAGNGHDCLFLAQAVGASGCVHAFDIQAEALSATHARLAQAGLDSCLRSHLCSHVDLSQHVPYGQRAVMFNLGFLPGSDHGLVTQASSSVAALASALELLLPHGRACVMAYPAHPGGDEEFQAIARFLASLPLKQFTVACTSCHNGCNSAPSLFSIEKQA